MKILECHARVTKFLKIIVIPYENNENHENPRIRFENDENNENVKIIFENYETNEIHIIQYEN